MRIFGLALPVFVFLFPAVVRGDDWPQWGGPLRDNIWRENGILEALPEKLSYKWRTKIGAGYAGPAVARGRIYVTDRVLEKGAQNPDNPFDRRRVKGFERILCLDESDGKILWKHRYPCQYAISYPYGPRATPSVDEGRVYCVGAMGDLHVLETATGKVLWSKQYEKDFGTEINTWGASAAPLIDGNKVILLMGGANGACVVALDKHDGREIWRALDADDPGYCPPVIFEVGGRRQLIVWTPQALHGLDPERGKLYWRQPFKVNAGLSVPTPIFDAGRSLLFVTSFYNGPLMMKLDTQSPTAKLIWKGNSDSERKTDKLHAIMCTPSFLDGYIYGVCSYGQLRCLEAATGKRVWETLEATGSGRWWNAFLIRHEDRYFIANEQGELITAKLSPQGYEETSRASLIRPTRPVQRRMVVWSHPAFANRSVYARNDEEIVCVDLRSESPPEVTGE